MAKRYYWLKLRNNFFQTKEVKKMLSAEGGSRYVVIYLKLLLLSLESEGEISCDGYEATPEAEIAMAIDESAEDVETVLDILEIGGKLMRLSDSEIVFTETDIGSEGDSAERVRNYRSRVAMQGVNMDMAQKVLDMYNETCKSFPKCMMTNARAVAIQRLVNNGMDSEKFRRAFELAENSEFLKGYNDTGWRANIDWILKGDNAIRVYEGQYDKIKPMRSTATPRANSFNTFSSQREYDEGELEQLLKARKRR